MGAREWLTHTVWAAEKALADHFKWFEEDWWKIASKGKQYKILGNLFPAVGHNTLIK